VATDFPLLGARVQMADGLKVPVLLVVKVTVPVGFVGVNEVSVTFAVHVAAAFVRTEPGRQAIVVVVGLTVGGTETAVRLKLPLLVACVLSPL
jgi:hypothetical protein